MLTLREIGEKTAAAKDVKGFWGQVIKGLAYNVGLVTGELEPLY